MTLKFENPLPRYVSGQKSVTDGRKASDEQRQNNIPPLIFFDGG